MPGYGVPADGEFLPWSYAEARLAGAHNYWLATVGAQGRPHLTVVWAVLLDGRLLLSTGRHSAKAGNLDRDPRCSIAPQCAHDGEAVLVEGRAQRVPVSELGPFVAAVQDKYATDMTAMLDEPVYAVCPEKVIALDETFNAHATRWRFAE